MLLLALGGRWAAGLRPGGRRTPWCAAAALRGSGVALWRAVSRAEPARLLSGGLLRRAQPGLRPWGAQVGRPGAGVAGTACGLGGSSAEGSLRVRSPEEQASASGSAAAAKGESDSSFLDCASTYRVVPVCVVCGNNAEFSFFFCAKSRRLCLLPLLA